MGSKFILDRMASRGFTVKQIATTNGGEYAFPCPSCGGEDRFRVWPAEGEHGSFWCRACERQGDAIQFLRDFEGMSFPDACRELGVQRDQKYSKNFPKVSRTAAISNFTPRDAYPPDELWADKAGNLLAYAVEQLQSFPEVLSWLEARGIPPAAAKRFSLGWLPGERDKSSYFRDRASWGLQPKTEFKNGKNHNKRLWIPRGLVIPHIRSGVFNSGKTFSNQAVRLKIRRPEFDRKESLPDLPYHNVEGSALSPMIFWPNLENRPDAAVKVALVIESELDSMACAHAVLAAKLPVVVIAMGSNTTKPCSESYNALSNCLSILVALDFDDPKKLGYSPGARGASWWLKNFRNAVRWAVPVGKDPGEAFHLGVDLAEWIIAGSPLLSILQDGREAAALPETSKTSRHPFLVDLDRYIDSCPTDTDGSKILIDNLPAGAKPSQKIKLTIGFQEVETR